MINEETIAKLVGQLNFHVDLSGLERFQRGMEQARQRMLALSRDAESLQKRLGAKMGLTPKTADHEKASAQIRRSLDRELKLETSAAKAKRATFAAELANQKLQFAGQREASFLTTQSLKDRQSLAVLAAKEQRAEFAKLKVQGQAIRNEDALVQAKGRQARIEALHAQQAQKTANLQAQQQRTLTSTQRIEQAMMQARERGQRQAQKYIEGQAAAKVRSQRQDVAHQQRQERFQWQQTRQAQWVANQNKPEAPTGFLGLGTGALAVGGAAAGAAAVVAAINALGERLSATQERVSGSQQFSNVLSQAGGANPANQKFVTDEFIRIGQKFGTALDIDSAKMFRTFVMADVARGNSLSKATSTFETRQAAFRGAGMTREEQTRANLQLQQIMSKSQGDREDLNTFSEAAPLLVEPIRRAWAERNKHALNGSLEKDFRASTTAGNLKAVDFTKGIELFVKENATAIQRQSDSIDANATRLSNQQFLQQQGVDQNPELIGAINERIKSEMELNEAMAPLKETAAQLDIALNHLMTSFLGWVFNKDGTAQTSGAKVDLLNPEKPAIDPSALTGVTVDSSRAGVEDPIDKLARKLFGIADYRQGPANGMEQPPYHFNGDMMVPKVEFPAPPAIDGDWNTVPRMPPVMTAGDVQSRATRNTAEKSNVATPAPVNTTHHHNTTVAPANVSVTINAPAGVDTPGLAKLVREEVRDELRQTYNEVIFPQDTE
jgi:hypothetical protein